MNNETRPQPETHAASALRQPRASRARYRRFVENYKLRRLDDQADEEEDPLKRKTSGKRSAKRREYVREYLRWLRPHRYSIATLLVLALVTAGLEMIEPLFMRYIIDRCS